MSITGNILIFFGMLLILVGIGLIVWRTITHYSPKKSGVEPSSVIVDLIKTLFEGIKKDIVYSISFIIMLLGLVLIVLPIYIKL